ncbi:PWWP domain-containing protein [Hamiltosporidium tvaerminnensis]|uniref:PWWP domain-containing protein n=1 Tax=Hamiltosporidium tvaerminnensis TaxID=1176355 RepID=A0A4Q9KTW1_9MICR|nr:PWWP domain-containing protein [Hamiltosporidium tvaerminnensis]
MFKPGDVVWSKYDEYPYWPSRIASKDVTDTLQSYNNTNLGIGVLFFGQNLTYALVEEKNICEFFENYKFYYKGSDEEDFRFAIEQAKSNQNIEDPPLELPKKKKRIPKNNKENNTNSQSNTNKLKETLNNILLNYPQNTEMAENTFQELESLSSAQLKTLNIYNEVYLLSNLTFKTDPLSLKERSKNILERWNTND